MKKVPRVLNVEWEGQTAKHAGGFRPESEWVARGEGRATIKMDGTACLVNADGLFARYDAKHGKTPPGDFVPAQPAPDPNTGHWPGWVPVTADKPQYKHHWAAWLAVNGAESLSHGTYELMGPHFQTNPYGLESDRFEKHGEREVASPDRTPEGLRALVELHQPCEGIVFHHPDGRMAKVCSDEFGIKWKAGP